MTGGGPDDTKEALAAFGLKLENEPSNEVEVWEENMTAARLFNSLQTQWRWKPNGRAAGLDYAAAWATMPMIGIKKKHRTDAFSRLQIMEQAGIKAINEG